MCAKVCFSQKSSFSLFAVNSSVSKNHCFWWKKRLDHLDLYTLIDFFCFSRFVTPGQTGSLAEVEASSLFIAFAPEMQHVDRGNSCFFGGPNRIFLGVEFSKTFFSKEVDLWPWRWRQWNQGRCVRKHVLNLDFANMDPVRLWLFMTHFESIVLGSLFQEESCATIPLGFHVAGADWNCGAAYSLTSQTRLWLSCTQRQKLSSCVSSRFGWGFKPSFQDIKRFFILHSTCFETQDLIFEISENCGNVM